ncbi:MAG: biotin--[acetyl-CoA-carboxylase] ligase [Bacteroidales bacterium]|nr:biotin--[acetyl-CoA-carboxylase] ligase [Bacteroidales bacterium]
MNPSQRSADIIWLDSTESTNRAVREAIPRLDNLSVIATVKQTAGRGQGSHTWHSTPGMNLTFSMLYKPSALPAKEMITITCATTLGIRDYLLFRGVESRIKWPNDIWVGDKKICGILIENILDGADISASIIGIGLNLNETDWPSDLPNPVSLANITGKRYDCHAELEALAEKIRRRFSLAGSDGGRKDLQEEFGKYAFRLPEGR